MFGLWRAIFSVERSTQTVWLCSVLLRLAHLAQAEAYATHPDGNHRDANTAPPTPSPVFVMNIRTKDLGGTILL
jgi:hypothetical protein